MLQNPLVDGSYLLQKFPGKGGWTYAEIPEIIQNKQHPFGWVTVKGFIDGVELNQYKLMPMGNGKLFLPVKAEIRKKIKKQEGDYVLIVLYADEITIEIPQDLIECFNLESPTLLEVFKKLPLGKQKSYLDWIYNSKSEETKAKRIIKIIEKLKGE